MSAVAEPIDIASHRIYADGVPHEQLAYLRREAPVYWHRWPGHKDGFWLLTKHAEVTAVGKDPKTFSSYVGHIQLNDRTPEEIAARTSMIEMDAPLHTRLRRLVSSAFTPRKVREYERLTRVIANELLDKVIPMGEFDWAKEISEPLPISILIQILDLPEEDMPWLVDAVTDMALCTDIDHQPDFQRWPTDVPRNLLPFDSPASQYVFEYGRKIGALRRENPGDDLVTRLVQADVDGERLTDNEYCNFFQLFIFAGNETTRTGISQGINAFLDNPDEWRRLREHPELADAMTEEVLRYGTPVTYFRRTATRDTEIRGVPIEAGDRVVMWYLSANYDEDVFEDPYRFDIGRDPNPHVTFGGGGPHFCLGAFLARLEIKVIFEEAVKRGVRFERAGDPVRLPSNFVNGYRSIPVRVVRD